eukprot:3743763-Prymnesium_polylepis.1
MAVQALHVQTGKTRGRARAQLRDGAAGHAVRAEVALAPRGRRSSQWIWAARVNRRHRHPARADY